MSIIAHSKHDMQLYVNMNLCCWNVSNTHSTYMVEWIGLSVIIHAILTSRCIFQRMKNYTIYAVSITIRIVIGFLLLALIWQFDFSPFMVLIIAILNDGTIMTISKVWIKPSNGFRKSLFFNVSFGFSLIIVWIFAKKKKKKTILWTFMFY